MTSTKSPLLLGHRGARRSAPENSIAAFDLALAHGCDGFEFDVRLTCDQRAIICHDPQTSGIELASAEYEKVVACLPQACCLEDVIARYACRAFLDMELKVAGLEPLVARFLREVFDRSRILVSSFLPDVLKSMNAQDEKIPLGYICDSRETLSRWPEMPCEVVIPQFRLIDEALVKRVHDADKEIFAWTVNRASDMRRLAEIEVDAVISDDTELLCRTLGGNSD